MRRTSIIKFLSATAALPLVALAAAGCGGGSSNAAAAPITPQGKKATIGVANDSLGKILVDSQGRTLYLFKKDSGTNSTCSGACATNWPPLRDAKKAIVGSGLTASKVGTAQRSDGKPQITYNGHPLYLFAGDKKAGDTSGQGVNAFGASWFAVSPSGTQVSGSASSSNSSPAAGGY